MPPSDDKPISPLKLSVGVVFNVLLLAVFLFPFAGTFEWTRAWTFLAVSAVLTTWSTLYLYRINPEVLKARYKSPVQKGQPLRDKFLVTLLMAHCALVVALVALDLFHYHWMERTSDSVSAAGFLLFVFGWWLITQSMKENRFASPAVRHQQESQHRIIDTGVYSFVRHPMYSGCIPWIVGTALWLQSWAAALVALLLIPILMVRINLEEDFLVRHLEGYAAYRERVRYRLIPYLW